MKFLKKYTADLPQYLAKAETPLEKYFLMWECFCKYSFESPQIYYAVFSADLGVHPKKLEEYYSVIPTDLLGFKEHAKRI